MSPAVRRVNLRDVAEAAGVSIQTVSRVVRGVSVVAEPTRERVMTAVRELNYQPNLAARSLSAHRTGSVHVIVAVPLFHGHAATFVAICQRLADRGLHISTTVVPPGVGPTADAADLVPLSTDGIIIIGGRTEPAPWVDVVSAAIPTVLVGRIPHGESPMTSVAIDQHEGAVHAVRHLAERGARKIIHVSGPLDWTDAAERHAGYLEACAELGLPTTVLAAASWDAAAAVPLMGQLPADADAVFAANDQLAIGCLGALHRRGVGVPADVAVVGFDDMAGADALWPPLTTLRQDFTRLGEVAVEALSAKLEGEPSSSTMLRPTLVVREST